MGPHLHRRSHRGGRGSGRARRGGAPTTVLTIAATSSAPVSPSTRRLHPWPGGVRIPARAPISVRPPAGRRLAPPGSVGRDQRCPVLSPPRLFPFPRIHARVWLPLPVRSPEGRDQHRKRLLPVPHILPSPRIPSHRRPPVALLTPRAWGWAAAVVHLTVLLTAGDGNDK